MYRPAPITAASIDTMIASFHDTYERRNGNRFPAFPVQGVTWRVELVVADGQGRPRAASGDGTGVPRAVAERCPSPTSTGRRRRAPSTSAARLRAGDVVSGPAVIREPMSTTFVPAERTLTTGEFGELVIH